MSMPKIGPCEHCGRSDVFGQISAPATEPAAAGEAGPVAITIEFSEKHPLGIHWLNLSHPPALGTKLYLHPPAAQPLPSESDASGLLADYVFHSAAMADLEQVTGTKDRGAHPDCKACHGAGVIGTPGKPCNFCAACWISDESAKLKAKEQPLPAGGVDEAPSYEDAVKAWHGLSNKDQETFAPDSWVAGWLARSRLSQDVGMDAIMEQASVYASAWSLVGSRFDNGNALKNANDAKECLREMVRSRISRGEGRE